MSKNIKNVEAYLITNLPVTISFENWLVKRCGFSYTREQERREFGRYLNTFNVNKIEIKVRIKEPIL